MTLQIRPAVQADLPAIAALLADDVLGAARERPADAARYDSAWRQIAAQPGNEIWVAVLPEGVVGCLQLIVIPGLARQGALRAQIEGVRVASTHRGQDIGERLFAHAIATARGGLPAGAAHDRQAPHRRAPLLRAAGLRGYARRHEARAGLKVGRRYRPQRGSGPDRGSPGDLGQPRRRPGRAPCA